MPKKVEFTRQASKDLRGLSAQVKQSILATLRRLEDDTRSVDIRKLQGDDNLYRVRDGMYRIFVSFGDEVIWVEGIIKRGDAY